MLEKLQKDIRSRFNSNISDENQKTDFMLFSISVTQKLWSSEFCLENLKNLNINDFTSRPTDSATQSSDSKIIQTLPLDVETYCLRVNFFLDGFFIHSMSALDTLAHEISILYSLCTNLNDIYITNVNSALNQNLKISRFLRSQLNLMWFHDFKDYRTCTTHESLIRISDIYFRFDHIKQYFELMKNIKLPDYPKIRPFRYEKKRMAINYCEKSFKKIKSFAFRAYKNILLDIERNNDIFPITYSS